MAVDPHVGQTRDRDVTEHSTMSQASATKPEDNRNASFAEILADVIIRTRTDLVVSRHVVSGKPQYVLQDEISFQSRALTLREYRIYASFDGVHTCSDNFRRLVADEVLSPEDEEDYYGFLLALHQRGVLDLPISNGKQLYERHLQRKARVRRSLPMQILCWKQSLGNPDRILNRCAPLLRFLFTWQALVVWSGVTLFVISIVMKRWQELVSPLASMLAEQNIFILMAILCFLKAWHELGHGVACKIWGGKVPDCGVLFIVGTPCAYIDASCAWSMPSRLRRIVISLGGVYFESFVAIAAFLIWCFAENPWTRSIAHHTMVLSTLTTLLFNINPLMKFDGYFVLSDALNMPNLRGRADDALRWATKRFLLGLNLPAPAETSKRLVGLVLFGLLATLYRLLIMCGIIGVLMWRSPILGIVLATVYLLLIGSQQLIQIGRYLWRHPETTGKRRQAILATTAMLGVLLGGVFIPFDKTVTLPGVFGYQNEHLVRGLTSGIMERKLVKSGDSVEAGEVIAIFSEPSISHEVNRTGAELNAVRLQLREAVARGTNDTRRYAHEADTTLSRLELLEERMAELQLTSPFAGKLIDWGEGVRVGAGLPAGQIIASVGSGQSILRVLVNQRALREYQPRVGEAVFIVLPWDWQQRIPAKIVSVAACSLDRVSAPALTQLGGGDIEVSPADMRPSRDAFAIEVLMDSPPAENNRMGVRASVQLPQRRTSIARWAWYRWLDFYRGFLREQV
ncbi:hypothetical protein SH139x_004493 [Planctomycetaceae bacterium SH139]